MEEAQDAMQILGLVFHTNFNDSTFLRRRDHRIEGIRLVVKIYEPREQRRVPRLGPEYWKSSFFSRSSVATTPAVATVAENVVLAR